MFQSNTEQAASGLRSSATFTVVGSAEHIRDLLCGPQDHNEHCKGWRWHLYVQDDAKRHDAVMAEVRLMTAERRAREEARQIALQAAE